ncbi:hypothetical protein LOAG_18880 [Loa loa]|uniref:Sister chromatid cohesion protein DCC1 n=1 Tax=Loa loa TaxID=7209 RepID=A0A1S0UDH0_LOALO|nr:hypothetical protein LOAG_18880 [Loa loa]EJD73710.1 hypothetical protein LOAG_18880 [Loa loa]
MYTDAISSRTELIILGRPSKTIPISHVDPWTRVTRTELQYLEFASPLLSGNYRLVEINPVLADRIMAGEQLVIRGDQEDGAVLCTHDATFDVKEVATSNVLLLLPEFHFNDEANANKSIKTVRKVIGLKNNFLELRQMSYVPVQRLKEKLHEGELEWDDEFNNDNKL